MKFESHLLTTFYITSKLPLGSYHVFIDVNILLDALGSSNLSDKDFIGDKYYAQKGKLENESAARIDASLGREFPIVFGKVDSTVAVDDSSSPFPNIITYSQFNIHEFQTHSR